MFKPRQYNSSTSGSKSGSNLVTRLLDCPLHCLKALVVTDLNSDIVWWLWIAGNAVQCKLQPKAILECLPNMCHFAEGACGYRVLCCRFCMLDVVVGSATAA
jgi:hypothetical protein